MIMTMNDNKNMFVTINLHIYKVQDVRYKYTAKERQISQWHRRPRTVNEYNQSSHKSLNNVHISTCILVWYVIHYWEYMHFLDLVQKFNIIYRTYHAQFTQWWFEGTHRTHGIYIMQDIIPSSNTNILKGFLATQCSENWDVQLVRGCITRIMFIDICNFYKHIVE